MILLETEATWTHAGIVLAATIPVFLFWLDSRKQQSKMHKENGERLIKIETMLQPIWDWWNKTNGK